MVSVMHSDNVEFLCKNVSIVSFRIDDGWTLGR